MTISIITLFPDMFSGVFDHSIIKRAQEDGHVSIRFFNLKDYGIGKHKIVDDTPYGGGVGMVLKIDVLDTAIQAARLPNTNERVILLDPKGTPYTQELANGYTAYDHIILVCGHYEGFDARIENFVDEAVSVGDYVLSGGEIPAMLITESVIRLIPNVLKKDEAHRFESFSKEKDGMLEHDQFTRPREYKGLSVPEVLLSGNAAKIEEFRANNARKATESKRPDLLR